MFSPIFCTRRLRAAPSIFAGRQSCGDVGRVLRRDELGQRAREREEILVLARRNRSRS